AESDQHSYLVLGYAYDGHDQQRGGGQQRRDRDRHDYGHIGQHPGFHGSDGDARGAGLDCDQSAGGGDSSGSEAAVHGGGDVQRWNDAGCDAIGTLEFDGGNGSDDQQLGGDGGAGDDVGDGNYDDRDQCGRGERGRAAGGKSDSAGLDCDHSADADDCSGHHAAVHGDRNLHRWQHPGCDLGGDVEFVGRDGG